MRQGVARLFFIFLVTTLLFAQERSNSRPRDLRIATIGNTSFRYQVVDGLAIVQGDMIIGTAAQVEAAEKDLSAAARLRESAVYLDPVGAPRPWTDSTIYYTIDPSLPNPNRVTQAIEHWNTLTPIKLVPRTGQVNYVFITRSSSSCAANVGMNGGQQQIVLALGCTTASVIHEIGHAAGLLHEQSRNDRNTFITVLYEFIDNLFADQFHQGSEVRDDGYYDYDSIMHYNSIGASADGRGTMQTVPPGIRIGQRIGLSAGDIDAVSRLYGVVPAQTTITTIPAGRQIVVDGETYTAPRSFNWGIGSTHTIEAPDRQGGATRFSFVRWTDLGPASHAITVSADRTVYAAVYRTEYFVQAEVGSGSGTVTVTPPSHDGYYPEGAQIRLEAIPAEGQQFLSWGGTDLEFFGAGRGDPRPVIELFTTSVFRANFTTSPITIIETDPPGLSVLYAGSEYITPIRFAWIPGTENLLNLTTPQFNFDGGRVFNFREWEDGSPSSLRTVAAEPSTRTITARFNARNYLLLDWTSGGFLATTPPSEDDYFDAGSTVRVEAVPGRSQTVQYWLGDTSGGGESKEVLMDRQRVAIAVFGPQISFRPLNAASYSANPIFDQPGTVVVPLEILTLFGDNLGPAGLVSGQISQGALTTELANTRVFFDEFPAPLVYASANQTSVIVPGGIAGRQSTTITVSRNGTVVGSVVATVGTTLPGIFTANASGRGAIAALNQDNSLNSSQRPAAPGSVVVLYATGAGIMDRSLPDGAVTGSSLARPQAPVYVRVDGLPADVLYAGSAPGLVHGALQVNFRVPAGLLPGDHYIQLIVGNTTSYPGTTLAVR